MAINPADQSNLAKLFKTPDANTTVDTARTGKNQFDIEAYVARQQRITAAPPSQADAASAKKALDAVAGLRTQNQRDFAVIAGLSPMTQQELTSALAAWDAADASAKTDSKQAKVIEQARGVLKAQQQVATSAQDYEKDASTKHWDVTNPTEASDMVDGAAMPASPSTVATNSTDAAAASTANEVAKSPTTDATHLTDAQKVALVSTACAAVPKVDVAAAATQTQFLSLANANPDLMAALSKNPGNAVASAALAMLYVDKYKTA